MLHLEIHNNVFKFLVYDDFCANTVLILYQASSFLVRQWQSRMTRVQGSGSRIEGPGSRVQGPGVMVKD